MLTEARFKFALESLKKYATMETEKQFVFSPHLIYNNLLIVYIGVSGENIFREILYIPNYISKAVVQQHYVYRGSCQFSNPEDIVDTYKVCQIHSKLLISTMKTKKDDPNLCNTRKLFKSQVKCIKFHDNYGRNYVNNRVELESKRNIREWLPPNSIHKRTDVALYNTIYYWNETKNKFMLDFDAVRNHTSEYLSADIIEVRFTDSKISAFFLTPKYLEKDNVKSENVIIDFVERLTTEKGSLLLHEFLDDGSTLLKQNYAVEFPRFQIEQDLRMHELLEMLDVPKLMPPGTIELNEFTYTSLKLGDTVHRIKFEMDSYVTAAASSAFFTGNSVKFLRMNTTTNIFHQTVTLIYDKAHCNILFCGVI